MSNRRLSINSLHYFTFLRARWNTILFILGVIILLMTGAMVMMASSTAIYGPTLVLLLNACVAFTASWFNGRTALWPFALKGGSMKSYFTVGRATFDIGMLALDIALGVLVLINAPYLYREILILQLLSLFGIFLLSAYIGHLNRRFDEAQTELEALKEERAALLLLKEQLSKSQD